MSSNAFNIIDLIEEQLTGDYITRMSSVLEAKSDTTHAGIAAAIPGLLAGLDSAASTPDGARRLASALDDSDDTILGRTDRVFGTGSAIDSGIGTLRSILGGGGFSDLTRNIGGSSGLSGKAVSSMVGLLVPIILGVIKRALRSRGLESSAVPNLLSSQRENITAAMSELGKRTYAEEPVREVVEETYTGPRAAPRGPADSYVRTEGSGGRGWPAWLLPVALLAGALGLMWYVGSRPSVQAGREPSVAAERARELMEESRGVVSDTLRAKYESVFREATAQGVQIASVREKEGKLLLKGTAPSQKAANRVWDEIKRIDPTLHDIVAEFRVGSSLAPSVP